LSAGLTLYGRTRYPLCGWCRCRPMQPMKTRQLAPKGLRCNGAGGFVRWGCGDFIRTRYRRRRFSTSLQEIWRTGDIHRPMNEVALIHHCPYASTDNLDLRCAPRKQLALASKHCQGRSRPTRADRPRSLPAFRTIYMYPKKLPDHLISRRFSGLIRLFIRRD
jgi:hypothetical protein